MDVTHPRRQALIALACILVPLGFVLPLRSAIVGLPLLAYFPAIAVATATAGAAAGAVVLLVAVVIAGLMIREPPLDFTLGFSANGLLFLAGFAISGGVIYWLINRKGRSNARKVIQAEHELALSGALSRWLSRNARTAATLMRMIDGAELQQATHVARERLMMAARVEDLLRRKVARDGADLTGVMTALCQELVRVERRHDLGGAISIAPMALDHEDFTRVCLVLADLLFLALREHAAEAGPLQVSLQLDGGEAVLGVRWLRGQTPSWSTQAHRLMSERVAGRVARALGGALVWSPPATIGPAFSELRFPAPVQTPPRRWRFAALHGRARLRVGPRP